MSDVRFAADPGHVTPGCANCFRPGHSWRACPDGDGPVQFTRPAYDPEAPTPNLVKALNAAISRHGIPCEEFNVPIAPSELVPIPWE